MASWILISGGSVIDGTGAEPVDSCSVLVKDDEIVAVGVDVGDEQVPRGEPVARVDATGKTVMPGLIDAHCHTSFGETRMQEEQDLYTSHELRTLRSAWNVTKVLRSGVTGISDPGGSYFIGVGIREGIAEGLIQGPRMTTAGRFLSTSNGISDFYPSSVGAPDSSIGKVVNTADEMVTEVRHQVKNGVDLIKIGDSPLGDYEAFSRDEIKAMSDAAHRLNKRITMHARGSNNVDAAVAAGLDWIMHGNALRDDTIERLADSRIPLCPALLLLGNLSEFGEVAGVPAAKRDIYSRVLESTAESLNKAREAGVTLIVGTDTGFACTPYGEWHARELELLMRYAGMSPLEAIKAATHDCAVVLGDGANVGSLVPGKGADIIVVDGDPVADIRVLQDKKRIQTVILRGEVQTFDDEVLAQRRPYNPAQHISPSDITYDLVFNGGAGEQPDVRDFSSDGERELLDELDELTATARRE
ncbi:MAG: amidohydrolase family protein [Acidimicrobiaceae bacterium]|nr:amidohydrolase family protein [Acidimicrobiaceae bacterium]MXZ64048.1 amidohydrolase family protein [Acidimicrobiaceae bacterium]MYJ84506.1 amidohydrolase family protein [Acidimicrobiaceae bacterium]